VVVEYPTILRNAGLAVHEVPGWRTNSHPGEFTPQGGMWHHTTALNDLDWVVHGGISGGKKIVGPLANLFLGQDGVFSVVCGGVASHAGWGTQSVLDNLRNGIAPTGDAKALGLKDDIRIANHFLTGIEVEGGVGNADDFTEVQLDSLIAGSAALCREFGYDQNHWIHHREWTNRKTDMAHRGDLRGRLAALLAGTAGPIIAASRTSSTTTTTTTTSTPVDPPPPVTEDVMYVVIEAPGRSPAFFTTDGQGHAMGPGGWTFINRFAVKHPSLVVFDSSWTAEEYDLVVRLPVHSTDEPIDGPPIDVTMPPDLLELPPDVAAPTVGTFNF
jgi:hypothetical protein